MRCPHFQYVHCWYQEGDEPFSQELYPSCLELWEDLLDRLERGLMSGTCVAEGTPTVRLAYSSAK